MKVLLVRHARAVARGKSDGSHARRPLTKAARARFGIAARGLGRIVRRVDAIMTSPRTRARDTAVITAGAFMNLEPVLEPALAGDRADAIVAALALQPPDATVALVGHEPLLGTLLARMVGSPSAERLAFKRGGAAFVDLPNGPASTGRLVWFLPPRVLRALAEPTELRSPKPNDNGPATDGWKPVP
jgi:phosphohistidine phosphatase